MGIKEHCTLLLQSLPPTAPSDSLCSQCNSHVWHAVSSALRLWVYMTSELLLILSISVGCHVFSHLVLLWTEDPSFTNKASRWWSEHTSDLNPWDLNHRMYCLFEVGQEEGQPTQWGGSLVASLTSLTPGVLSSSSVPCCSDGAC